MNAEGNVSEINFRLIGFNIPVAPAKINGEAGILDQEVGSPYRRFFEQTNPHGHFSVLATVRLDALWERLIGSSGVQRFEKKTGIPANIRGIDMLVLDPEEVLPEEMNRYKQLGEPYQLSGFFLHNELVALADGWEEQRWQDPGYGVAAIRNTLNFLPGALGDPDDKNSLVALLHDALKQSKQEQILFITGHGGGDPWTIGEAYDTISVELLLLQLRDILERHVEGSMQLSDRYAAIIIKACNGKGAPLDQEMVDKIGVPIFYPMSLAGSRSNNFPTCQFPTSFSSET